MEKATVQQLYDSLLDKVYQIENQMEREDLSFFFVLTPSPSNKKWTWRKSSTHFRINGVAEDKFNKNLIVSFDISGSMAEPSLAINYQYPSKKVTAKLYFKDGKLNFKESTLIYKTETTKTVLKQYKDGKCFCIRKTIQEGAKEIKSVVLVRSGDRFVAVNRDNNLENKTLTKKYYSGELEEDQTLSLDSLKNPRKIVEK